jgi:hypothetical protein
MKREQLVYSMMGPRRGIVKGDIVYHQLSKLLFRCENLKHERWMNMNPFYQKTELKNIDYSVFEKTKTPRLDNLGAY